MTFYIDMDGVVARYDRSAYIGDTPMYRNKTLNYFRDLPPDPKMIAVVNKLLELKQDVVMFTSVDNVGSYALVMIHDKIEWLHKNIPNLDTDKQFLASLSSKRSIAEAIKFNSSHTHINGQVLSIDDILIDDWNNNLNDWHDAGGTAIKYNNGINDPESFDGINLDIVMTTDDIVELLTKHINYIRKET